MKAYIEALQELRTDKFRICLRTRSTHTQRPHPRRRDRVSPRPVDAPHADEHPPSRSGGHDDRPAVRDRREPAGSEAPHERGRQKHDDVARKRKKKGFFLRGGKSAGVWGILTTGSRARSRG